MHRAAFVAHHDVVCRVAYERMSESVGTLPSATWGYDGCIHQAIEHALKVTRTFECKAEEIAREITSYCCRDLCYFPSTAQAVQPRQQQCLQRERQCSSRCRLTRVRHELHLGAFERCL